MYIYLVEVSRNYTTERVWYKSKQHLQWKFDASLVFSCYYWNECGDVLLKNSFLGEYNEATLPLLWHLIKYSEILHFRKNHNLLALFIKFRTHILDIFRIYSWFYNVYLNQRFGNYFAFDIFMCICIFSRHNHIIWLSFEIFWKDYGNLHTRTL